MERTLQFLPGDAMLLHPLRGVRRVAIIIDNFAISWRQPLLDPLCRGFLAEKQHGGVYSATPVVRSQWRQSSDYCVQCRGSVVGLMLRHGDLLFPIISRKCLTQNGLWRYIGLSYWDVHTRNGDENG